MSLMIDTAAGASTALQLHARKTAGYDDRVAHALSILREAAATHAGCIVQASSLGAEDMVSGSGSGPSAT